MCDSLAVDASANEIIPSLNAPKKVKLAMPTTMAGIVGMTANEKLSDFEIDPKHFLIFVAVLLIVAKVFHILIA